MTPRTHLHHSSADKLRTGRRFLCLMAPGLLLFGTDGKLWAQPGVQKGPGSRNLDLPDPVNHGELDDRTSRHEYAETRFEDDPEPWGTYRIAAGTVMGHANLSPRMERKLLPRVLPVDGNYQYFKGTFRIEKVCPRSGTCILQAKGTHEGHVDRDPALCLIMAKEEKNDNEVRFVLYREEILRREGRLSDKGRQLVKLTTVKRHEPFEIEMKTGFSGTPVNRHYVNLKINGVSYDWDVPSPEKAFETGIRYGAYGVKTGEARIHVSRTDFSFRNEKQPGR